MDAGCIHVSARHIAEDQAPTPAPRAVVHRALDMADQLLDHGQDALVAGAQVVLGQRNGGRTEDPRLEQNLLFVLVLLHHLLDPAAHVRQITLVAG